MEPSARLSRRWWPRAAQAAVLAVAAGLRLWRIDQNGFDNEARAVRFVMLGDLSIASRYMGADSAGRPLAEWVRAHGRPVDASVWGGTLSSAGRGSRRQLYDLKPEAGLVPASEKGRS